MINHMDLDLPRKLWITVGDDKVIKVRGQWQEGGVPIPRKGWTLPFVSCDYGWE